MSERALKAREHHSMHALIVRSYIMSGSLSLAIGTFLVLNFGNEFTSSVIMAASTKKTICL